MNGISTLLLFVGLFLLGGVYSFAKQKQSKSVITLLSVAAGMCLIAGIVRLEVWN
ncbi:MULTISPECIES: hypothetical protein [Streptomyces]|uniref:Amidotransferase n=1 Tax=Streptomyces silvensis TaxID=1765722 RepID=A0A0W7WTK7_9ACTN|nr:MULTISPECIES: hypothetical protein [Streptomyces]KUF13930.1 amidotransferase [Streptomyces silvensis]